LAAKPIYKTLITAIINAFHTLLSLHDICQSNLRANDKLQCPTNLTAFNSHPVF